jgi:putative membrane-bound dehydrogenase-like protein
VPNRPETIDQGKTDPRLKGYATPKGVRLEIVADHPVVTNPVGMAFAHDGTLYVLEWRPFPGFSIPEYPETLRYKDGTTRSFRVARKAVRDVQGKVRQLYPDAVQVLRDTRGHETYDKAELLLEDELPSAVLPHSGWLYLAGRGSVRRYRQSKPGGPYGVREEIVRGLGALPHQVSGLALGVDGWMYITAGAGDHFAEGSDGSRATVLRTGAVFRCLPDGSKMHVYARGLQDSHGPVAFDAAGNVFHADAGGKHARCRLLHLAEEADLGARLPDGARGGVPDPVRGALADDLPGVMPPLLDTGRGASTGVLVYNDTRFPEPYRGLLYAPDPARRRVRAYRVVPRGASFEVAESFDLLNSSDSRFRPCQVVLGPDGALYVCDRRGASAGRPWADIPGGRIYRLRWVGTGEKNADGDEEQSALLLRTLGSWARITRLSDDDLLKALGSEEASFRLRAGQEFVRRGLKHRGALVRLLADGDAPQRPRIAARGALVGLWDKDVAAAFRKLLGDKDSDLRRLAAEDLARFGARGDRDVQAALLPLMDDAEPAVRRAAALAVGRIAAPGAADALAVALQFDDGNDRWVRDGLVRAVERLGRPGLERLMDLANSGVTKDRDNVVEVFRALRTAPAVPLLGRLLENPHLGATQRAGLVRSYGNYLLDPPLSPAPMLGYLTRHPGEDARVKRAGVLVLGAAEVIDDPKAKHWLLTLLDERDPALRLALLAALEKSGLSRAAPKLDQWRRDADRPTRERRAAARALQVLRGVGLDTWVTGPFGGELKTAYPPEKDPVPWAVYPRRIAWQPWQVEAGGLLDLRGAFPGTQTSVYALASVYSPRDQEAKLLAGSGGPLRIWLSGKLVHEFTGRRAPAADTDRVAVHLAKGWNRVLAKVVGGKGDHALFLRFAGDGVRVARR